MCCSVYNFCTLLIIDYMKSMVYLKPCQIQSNCFVFLDRNIIFSCYPGGECQAGLLVLQHSLQHRIQLFDLDKIANGLFLRTSVIKY